MKVSIEILRHFTCSHCGGYWAIGDCPKPVSLGSEFFCTHCGKQGKVEEIVNGKGQQVRGVGWLLPVTIAPPIILEE